MHLVPPPPPKEKGEIGKNGYTKFGEMGGRGGGVNKVHSGLYEIDEF